VEHQWLIYLSIQRVLVQEVITVHLGFLTLRLVYGVFDIDYSLRHFVSWHISPLHMIGFHCTNKFLMVIFYRIVVAV
jgi:hypothetical protein